MKETNPEETTEKAWEAVESKNEGNLKLAIIESMDLFLQHKISKEELDSIASLYLTVPIQLGWKVGFEPKDKQLRYVLEQLSAIEVVDDVRATLDVKRYLAYLKGEDYEKIQ